MSWENDPIVETKSSWQDDPVVDEKTVGGFARNLGDEAGGIAKSLHRTAKTLVDPLGLGESLLTGSMQPAKDKIANDFQAFKSIPASMIDEGKRIGIGELATGNYGAAADKFGDALYEKPIATILDIAPLAGGAANKFLGRGARAAGVADEAARAGTGFADDAARVANAAPDPVAMPDEAAQILKEQPEAPPPPPPTEAAPAAGQDVPLGSTFQETVQNLGQQLPAGIKKPLDEVGDFLTKKYDRAAAKPGFGDTLGDMAIRKGQSMRFQEIGFTPGQIRKLIEKKGEDWVRSLSDLAKEKGITKPIIGYEIGKNIERMEQSAGKMVGGIRDIASKRGAVHDTEALVNQIRSQLDSKYLKGSGSSQKGAYMKALQDIRTADPSAAGLAKAISAINEIKTGAKMTQPVGAMTDVANLASRYNNELINKFLAPKEMTAYKDSLRDFGAAKIFGRGYAFRASRELGGRAGVGGLWRNLKQSAMDVGGGKVMENFFDRIGPKLKKTPELASDLGDLSGEALSDLLKALDDTIDEIVVK